ncbi:MAG: hypothetical protein QOJ99_62 [Bryobacterales bacterium]|jgi:muconolactone delta-isomerase|nr:hypothetical protein [Bryobacterales bacterium]
MQFLTISRLLPGVSGDSLAVLGQQESQRARTLYVEGHLRQIWYRDDTSGACLLWEADSEDQVRNMLATLPFAKAGLLEITIIPLRPYAGFGP